jgi:hypothetical protein
MKLSLLRLFLCVVFLSVRSMIEVSQTGMERKVEKASGEDGRGENYVRLCC